MTTSIITVEHLSKAYRIGLKEHIPDTFVGAMTSWLKAPLRNWRRLRRLNTFGGPAVTGQQEEVRGERSEAGGLNGDTDHHSPLTTHQPEDRGSEVEGQNGEPKGHGHSASELSTPNSQPTDIIWALRDVSFDVQEGEVVGIIGRNGAGKSTLLKILSRITEPTSGRATIRGRVSSLLEVGTGFHPELTGRENIYMNGTILGMKKREIDRKFDEIVAFSGVETFLDTPVKRYSSGMSVRLAFAVAAHLEPEILLVDEVLAVGDGEFQKKCLGKMQDVARRGRTVLFVSHNMGMVTSLCQRAMLLEAGTLDCDGAASETVLSYYSRGSLARHSVDFSRNGHKVGDDLATLLEAWIEDLSGNRTCEVDIRTPFRIKMRYAIHEPVPKPPYPNFHFFDSRGEYAFVCAGNRFLSPGTEPGTYLAECTIPGNLMNNGTYFIGLALTFTHSGIHVSFYEKQALSVSVRDPIEETLETVRNGYSGPIPGPVRPQLEWLIHKVL